MQFWYNYTLIKLKHNNNKSIQKYLLKPKKHLGTTITIDARCFWIEGDVFYNKEDVYLK